MDSFDFFVSMSNFLYVGNKQIRANSFSKKRNYLIAILMTF